MVIVTTWFLLRTSQFVDTVNYMNPPCFCVKEKQDDSNLRKIALVLVYKRV